jgi:hypothetical protein
MRGLIAFFFVAGCSTHAPAPPGDLHSATVIARRAGVSLSSDGLGAFSLESEAGASSVARLRAPAEARPIVEARPTGLELSLAFEHPRRSVSIALEAGVAHPERSGVAIRAGLATFHVGHGTWVDARGARFDVDARTEGNAIVYDVPPGVQFPATLDPMVSAETDLDAPTLGFAAGRMESTASVFDGTNFVVAWESQLGRAARSARIGRVSTTGAILDGTGSLFGPGVQPKLASSGGETLVAWGEAGKLRAARLGKDGKLVDATPIEVGPLGSAGYTVAWDGARYALVYDSGGSKFRLSHVTTAGALVEPTGIALGATFDTTLDSGTIALACGSTTCMFTHVQAGTAQVYAARIAPSGLVGGDVLVQPVGAYAPLASNGTDFLHVNGSFETVFSAARISAAGVVAGPTPLLTANGLALAGNAGGYVVLHRSGPTLQATKIATSGPVAAAWTADLGPVSANSAPDFSIALAGTTALAIGGTDVPTHTRARLFDVAAKPTTVPAPFAFAKGAPSQYQTAIASDGTSYLVAWHEERDGARALYARTFTKGGAPISSPVVVQTFGEEAPTDLVAAFDGARYHLAYRTAIDLPGPLVHVRVATDGTLVDAKPVQLDSGGYATRPPTIAAGDGRTLIAWIDGGEVFVERFDDKGAPLDASPVPVGHSISTYLPLGDSRVGASWDGKRFLVSFPSPVAASTDISAVFVDDSAVSDTFSVASTPSVQHDPASAFGGGVHLVAWLDLRPDVLPAIRAVRVAPDGKLLDASPIEVATDVCEVCAPTVRWDGGAFVVGVMKKLSIGRVGELVLARVRADGVRVIEPVTSLTKGAFLPYFATQPSIATDGKGTTLAATSQIDDSLAASRVKLRAFEAKKPAGATCAAAAECDDGTCVDGVCCATACTGPCEACDVPGSLGTCATVAGPTQGTRSCGAPGDTCAVGACDGKDATRCATFALSIGGVCGAPTCKGSAYLAAPTCSDARLCTAPAEVQCSPYRCAPSGCLKTCAADDDCVDQAKCVAGSCVPSTSGARCTDDHLASVAKDGTVTRCAPYRCDTDGACAKACVASSECVPGFVCDVASSTCAAAPEDAGDSGGCSVARGESRRTRAGGGLALLLFGALLARRRGVFLSLSVALFGCRSSEPIEAPIGATTSALVASPAHATSEPSEDAFVPQETAIACNAGGCLYVSARPPWLVGQRLGTDGSPVDAKGFVIASSLATDTRALAVGTDGTDYLVTFGRDVRPPAVVSVSAAGKVGTPSDLVPASTFTGRAAIGWDGKTWVVAYKEERTGKPGIDVVRIGKDGKHLDVFGTTVLGSPTDHSLEATIACDSSGCLVAGGDPYSHGGSVAHVVDGKVDKGPTILDFAPQAMVRQGADLLLAGLSTDGARAARVGTDATLKAPSKQIASGSFQNADLAILAGTPIAMLSGGYPYPLTLVKLDATLAPTTTSAPISVPFKRTFGAVELSGTLYTMTSAGLYGISSALAVTRKPIERRTVPHRFPATATDGTTRILAYARRSDGHDAIFVSKVAADGTLDGTPTLVAAETTPIADVAATFDGTSFVVGWTSYARAATARVSPALAVLDPGGVAIVDASGFSNGLCGIRFGRPSTGPIAFVGINNTAQLASVRIASTGKPVDVPARLSPAGSIACELDVATSGDTSYAVYGQGFGGGILYGQRFGGDGKPIGGATTLTAGASTQTPAVLVDGTSLFVVGSERRTGSLGYDIVGYRAPLDLSGAPYAAFIVSARDADQLTPALSASGGKTLVAWAEELGDRAELRASLVDLAAKSVLVDAARIDAFGPHEVGLLRAAQFDGKSGLIAYERTDPDPAILSTRIHARTISFGALGAAVCTSDAECELGPCVDGVCCDRACDGACEACNEPGSVGTCTTVAGTPRGARTCGGTGCAEATCDGFEAKSCQKFTKAFETRCAEPVCMGALFTAPGYCDGVGGCAVPKTASCAPYACDVNGCRTSCASDASCAMGFLCKDGKCVAPELKASCDENGLGSIGADGERKDCAPYRCGAEGTCLKTCASSLDCAPGSACDVSSGACTAAASEDTGGGCSLARPSADRDGALGVLLVIAGASFLRRRRPGSA